MRPAPGCIGGWLPVLGGLMIMLQQTAECETRIPRNVEEAAALHLAAEGYFGTDKKLGFLDYDSKNDSFFIFDGLSEPPAEGSFGFFAVNRWTGDVWNLWGCHRLSTPALRKSQAAIRRRFSADELKQYTRLRRLKPECIFGD